MIAIVLMGLLACAGAAPHWRGHGHHHSPHAHSFHDSFEQYIDEEMFDTKKFWDEWSRDFNREMMQLETMLSSFSRHFPSMVSTEGIEGNEYKVVIPLPGFDEKEIVVKGRKGLLMIQAVHSVAGEPEKNYLDIRTLPACVGEQGNWSYKDDVLTLIFPIEKNIGGGGEGDNGGTEKGDSSTELVTPIPNHSREETEKPAINTELDTVDIDDRGDTDKENALNTNEVEPKVEVEATTYAVDLKGEVEFVPVRY